MICDFRNFVLQNFPFLEDDFDALTDYELFCKICGYVIEYSKDNEEMKQQIAEFQTYFDNLDLQEEVDKKLDEMAEDGTLEDLFKDYIDEAMLSYKQEINGIVEEQNNVISTVSNNQNTLSDRMDSFTNLESGSTTGDAELIDGRISFDSITYSNIGGNIRNSDNKINNRINKYINTNILQDSEYVNGALDTSGGITPSNDYITTKEFIDIAPHTKYYLSYGRRVLWYNGSTVLTNENISYNNAYDLTVTSPSNANKCRITFPASKLNEITMNKVEDEFSNFGTEKVKNAIAKVNNLLLNKPINTGYYNAGYAYPEATNYRYYADLKVKGGHTYTVYPRVRFVCFYQNDYLHSYVGNLPIGSDPDLGPQSFTPVNDGYVYVSVYASDYTNGLCKMVDTTNSSIIYPVDARVMNDTIIPNEETIEYLKYRINNSLDGLKLYNFGDSIGAGDGNNGVGYAEMLETLYNFDSHDYAHSGDNQTMGSILTQIENASSTQPDIILLEGGANDFTQYRPMGNMTNEFSFDSQNFDETTFIGALEMALNKLTTKYPGVPIIWIYTHRENTRTEKSNGTVTVNFTTMHDRSIETCNKWSIPVVDIYNESGLNTMLSYYRTNYTSNGDGTHPNENGYLKYYIPFIIEKIKEIKRA